ncbi:MAG: DUF6617 family protein [Salinivirgaceae bacterium]
MPNSLTQLDAILYRELRPWLDENKIEEKFASTIAKIPLNSPHSKTIYDIDFHRPFNKTTEFYQKIIVNETNAYCNKVYDLISDETDERVQKYWLNDILNKKLHTRLNDIGKLIQEKQYFLEYINPYKSTLAFDFQHKTETYVIQLLKIALIKIYLEIQDPFKGLIKDFHLIESDFYTRFFNEPIADKSFLKQIQQPIEVQEILNPTDNKVKEFVPREEDFRGTGRIPVNYKDIRNTELFSHFENELYLSNIIDADYNFIDSKGNKNLIAATYKILIQKKYFRKTNAKNGRDFEAAHFRQYLDHRYKVDTSQQFRKLKEQDIETIKNKHRWIENIEYCR